MSSPAALPVRPPRPDPLSDNSCLVGEGWDNCYTMTCLQSVTSSSLSALNKAVKNGSSMASVHSHNDKSWRKAAATAILDNSDEDEPKEEEKESYCLGQQSSTGGTNNALSPFTKVMGTHPHEDETQSVVSQLSYMSNTSTQMRSKRGALSSMTESQSNPRVVAPHVGKLGLSSCVEVVLKNSDERVTVLCSADILKMKSTFFHDVLLKQEEGIGSKLGLWRAPIEIQENTPFEAVSFLEKLHDSGNKVGTDWFFAWARLSVRWTVEEMLREYASQIDAHFQSLSHRIRQTHWRTSPETLVGMRIAVFRKASTCVPTVVTGTIVSPLQTTGYSKLRVAFDPMPEGAFQSLATAASTTGAGGGLSIALSPTPGGLSLQHLRQRTQSLTNASLAQAQDSLSPIQPQPPQQPQQPQQPGPGKQIVADVCEPIWVRDEKEGGSWMEPDELYACTKPCVSVTDRRLWWEMCRAVVTLPPLAGCLQGHIKNSGDITAFLLRKENKVLWYPEAQLDFLPKDDALELIKRAYCLPIYSTNTP